MIGRRIESPFAADGGLRGEWPQPGDYYRDMDNSWRACTPNGHLANLSKHCVVEHEDKTITVRPSILVSNQNGVLWHGYLKRGVWGES